MLKPIYGLERDLDRNLRSALSQDFPDYQVVMSVQRLDDPALPLLRRLEQQQGPERATVVAVQSEPVVNGKVQNLENALSAARHDILVISDSDVFTPADYLARITAPLCDAEVGYVCTLYKGVDARSWYEQLELLTYNTEFIPSTVFAYMTGASGLCLGASVALRQTTLDAVGGLASLADYLVEDYELGRRILARGQGIVLLPYFVDLTVDLDSAKSWWRHQIYWDQNTRAARPLGFAASVLTRAVPFALLYAAFRLFDPLGLAVLLAALIVRLGTAAGTALVFRDRAGLCALWLLPLRDLAGLLFWVLALGKQKFVWRGHEFELARGGRIVPRRSS
jgi:ceramide glucosyltransferase